MASVEWHPWASQTLSLSHGRGYRSAGSIAADTQFGPERDASTELSWRGLWFDGGLHTSLTAFVTHTRDRFTYTAPDYAATVAARGAEAEVEADLGAHWHLRAGVGRQDSHYARKVFVGGSSQVIQPTPGAPAHTAVAGLRYGQEFGVYGALDAYRTSAAESLQYSYRLLRRPGYSLLDLRIGFRRPGWDTALIVANALDATYVDRAERSVQANYRLGDPRRIEWRTTWTW